MGTLLVSRGAARGRPALAGLPLDAGPRARDPRRLRVGRRADRLDEHVGREPLQAHEVRLGRLAREDQPGGREARARRGRRRIRLRRGRRRPARPAREAVRAAHAPARPRDLHGADPDPPRGEGRPPPLRDVLLLARDPRGPARRARPLDGDPRLRVDDVPRGRQDELRRRGRREPPRARARPAPTSSGSTARSAPRNPSRS